MSFVPIVVNIINQKYRQIRAYIARVARDGRLIRNQSISQQYYQLIKQNNLPTPVFSWFGEAGYKERVSGIYRYATKLYSMFGTNDATQTTSTSQPYLSGNIAPNEKLCLKNPNGDARYMTHPTISFAANEAWSVTTVLNFNGDLAVESNSNNTLFGDIGSNNTLFGLKHTSNNMIFRNSSGTVKQFTKGIDSLNGKTIVIHIVAIGNDTLSVYINGILYETITTITTNVVINKLLGYGTSYFGYFKLSAHTITPAALTPSQVAIQANFLRNIYPEIPSVTIGSQTWATSNCEMVATPQGNLIANVTENANVEKITNIADREFSSDTGFWSIGVGNISGGSFNITGVNGFITRVSSITFGKWYKVIFTISGYTSGIAGISSLMTSDISRLVTANGTYTIYVLSNSTTMGFSGQSGCVFDNVSVQEIGWEGSTELYDGIYAQTAGTVEQKTYAAVKAAGFWSHYNNDMALGSVYGKLYNWYAVKLLQMDIDYYNVANPTTPWGWRVPAYTDFNTLATNLGGASVAGGKMKKDGLLYWTTPNTGANNSSGFSALSGGCRLLSAFTGMGAETDFHTTSAINYFMLFNSSAIILQVTDKIFGFAIRLIKS